MTMTRRVLAAANTQLKAQLAACSPESRKSLKAKLAAARDEVTRLDADLAAARLQVKSLNELIGKQQAQPA